VSGPKVVVVGGGVIGISCAYYLARGGARVVVLERERIGAGASSGNAGTVSPGHPPLNKPGRVGRAVRQMLDPTSPLYVRPSWNPGLWRWKSSLKVTAETRSALPKLTWGYCPAGRTARRVSAYWLNTGLLAITGSASVHS